MKQLTSTTILILLLFTGRLAASDFYTAKYNPVWTSQSKNSYESMPCGGGDIGLNVWVENGDLLFYMQQSGAFDENNTSLKAGRVRVRLNPNPFKEGSAFKQELKLQKGCIEITGKKGKLSSKIFLWVDVFHPVIHVEMESSEPVEATATYESWRYEDRNLQKNESFQNSYKWAPPEGLQMKKDKISFSENEVWFFHQDKGETVFDITVAQQGLDSVKNQLYNPLKHLISGGCMYGDSFTPSGNVSGQYVDTPYKGWQLKSKKSGKEQQLTIVLNIQKAASSEEWEQNTEKIITQVEPVTLQHDRKATQDWWKAYWERSFIQIGTANSDTSKAEEVARNYRLFRYMLGCNAYGKYPTKFNGGLFTVDPVFTDKNRPFTPDYRNWGGGTFTAQNQRLVYYPLFKSGDADMLKPQLDFYLRILKNAELRSEVYWNHSGACFTEQLENFGLPNFSEYGLKRPGWYDKGMQYNAWLEYQWDTALEFCHMAMLWYQYTGKDISAYIPMIESCLTFFDEHYQYLSNHRGSKTFDADGKLILYPGSACETYKMATNSTSTIAALKVVASELIKLPEKYMSHSEKDKWSEFLKRIPDITLTKIDGRTTIAPAKMWERVNNEESPQLYPVFPWKIYGIGKPGLEIAVNTWNYDPDVQKFRSYIGWKQDAIWAAHLGLTNEAVRLIQLKLGNAENRFTAFWGPGFDWTPDHNWGGSGMIALQDMLLQTSDNLIILFPAWPKKQDVHFKLHAPENTTVEAELKGGKLVLLKVTPAKRKKDVINWFDEGDK